jgi:hypothetical protein
MIRNVDGGDDEDSKMPMALTMVEMMIIVIDNQDDNGR